MNTSILNVRVPKNAFAASKSLLQFAVLLGVSFVVVPMAVLTTLMVVSMYGYVQSSPNLMLVVTMLMGG